MIKEKREKVSEKFKLDYGVFLRCCEEVVRGEEVEREEVGSLSTFYKEIII